MKNTKIKVVISILLVFIAGLLVGGILTFLLLDHKNIYLKSHHFKARQLHKRSPIEFFSKELNLSPKQKSDIEAIFKKSRQRFIKLNKENRTQLEKIRRETRDKIIAILDEEQKRKFEGMIKKWGRKEFRGRKRIRE